MESCSQDHGLLTYGRTSSEMNIIEQCFSTMDDFTSKGTLDNVWGHVLMVTTRGRYATRICWREAGGALNPQCMGQPHLTQTPVVLLMRNPSLEERKLPLAHSQHVLCIKYSATFRRT